MDVDELQREIDRLATAVENKTDSLAIWKHGFLSKKVKERLLPTTLPVKKPCLVLRLLSDGPDCRAPCDS